MMSEDQRIKESPKEIQKTESVIIGSPSSSKQPPTVNSKL